MRFVDSGFLFQFLPVLLALYFLVHGAAAAFRLKASTSDAAVSVLLVGASVLIIARSGVGAPMLVAATFTLAMAAAIDATRGRAISRGLLDLAIGVNVLLLLFVRYRLDGRTFMFAGAWVMNCHLIAYVMDVYRGEAAMTNPLTSALYLVQFPPLPAGPIVRYRDFARNHLQLERGGSLGSFSYGTRRLIIGLVKILLVARTLGGPVDAMFSQPVARLSTGAAWLAAVCVALQIYFQCSGYADIAIGLGRMVGLRYPENFRRPYVADSTREFWRRWNITSIMWLRDYLSLPIAGREKPTPRLFANILIGFCLIGLWHGGGINLIPWALYSGSWLALEAIGLGAILERLPRVLRHVYLLMVVMIGWVILRADSMGYAASFLQTLAGLHGGPVAASGFLTLQVWLALGVAIVGAGPLIPWISRWRVTLDATTAALVMMMSAATLFIWRGGTLVADAVRSPRTRK